MAQFGIDVSDNNRGIDWGAAFAALQAQSGGSQPFAIIKLTEGTGHVDSYGVANVNGAVAAGFEVAAYHFGRADQDGGRQGQLFAKHVTPLLGSLGITLGDGSTVSTFFDLEDTPSEGSIWGNLALSERVQRVGNCLGEMDAVLPSGQLTGIYTSPGWFNDTFPGVDWSGRNLWIASWGTSSAGTCGQWVTAAIWQYADQGVVAGVGSGVDLDQLV